MNDRPPTSIPSAQVPQYRAELRKRALQAGIRRLFDLFAAIVSILAVGALMAALLVFGDAGFGLVNLAGAFIGISFLVVVGFFLHSCWKEGVGSGSEAKKLDKVVRNAAGRFYSAWFFEAKGHDNQYGYSNDLIGATQEWCEQAIQSTPSLNQKDNRGLRLCAAVLFGAAFLAFFVLPGAGQRRMDLAKAASWFWIEPTPVTKIIREDSGDLIVPRGAPLTLWIEAKDGDSKVSVDIGSGTNWENLETSPGINGRWEVQLPEVIGPITYAFIGPDWSNPLRKVKVVDAPKLTRLSWDIVPPDYTFLPETHLENDVWDLSVPEGSVLSAHVQADQEIHNANISIGSRHWDLTGIDFSSGLLVKEKVLSASFAVESGGPFRIRLENAFSLSTHSATGQVSVIRDATPRAIILSPEPVVKVEGDQTVQIQALLKDDYGIGKVVLHTERNYENGTRQIETLWQTSSIPSSATTVNLDHPLDMKPFDLYPGDEVTYWLTVCDTDAIHGPKTGKSDVRIIRFPSLAEVYDDLFTEEETQVMSFQELLEQQKTLSEQAQETSQDLRDRMEQKGEAPTPEEAWDERRDLQELKERQEQLQEEYKAIQESLEEMVAEQPQVVEEDTGFSEEVLEKVERIQELLNELVTEEGKNLLEQIDRIVDEMAEQIDPENVEDLAYSFKEYEQDLDRTLEQLERAFQERQMEGLSRVAEDLQNRQDALQEETNRLEEELAEAQNETGESQEAQDSDAQTSEEQKQKAERLAERQEQLRQDTEAFMEQLEQTAQMMEEKNPEAAQKLREARESLQQDQVQKAMEEASESLQQMNTQQAMQQQQKAQESLQKLNKQLEDSKESMGGGGMSITVDMQVLEEIFQRGLFLSRWNETLVKSPLARRRSLRSLEEAGFCRIEAERLAAEWDELTRGNPFLDRSVIKEFTAAGNSIRRAMEQGEGRVWIGYGHAQNAQGHLNKALWLIQQNLRSLAQQSGGGGAEDLMQQLQQMAQQQKELNQQSQQLRQQGTQRQKIMEQLKRMAQQQAKMRQEIRQLMQEYRHVREMQSRMDGIAQEMAAIEKKLESGELDSDLQDRQERLLTRMLEAQVTQEQDIMGRRRQAETSKEDLVQSSGDDIRFVDQDDIQVETSESDSPIPSAYRGWVKTYMRELGRLGG